MTNLGLQRFMYFLLGVCGTLIFQSISNISPFSSTLNSGHNEEALSLKNKIENMKSELKTNEESNPLRNDFEKDEKIVLEKEKLPISVLTETLDNEAGHRRETSKRKEETSCAISVDVPRTSENIKEVEQHLNAACLQPLTTCQAKNLVGWLKVDTEYKSTEWLLKNELSFVQRGGWWAPNSCKTDHQVAIVVPFRDRQEHLHVFLRQLHPMLMRSNIHYRVFIIEQNDTDTFNRGKLMNVGFKEALKFFPYTCFVFHDVDLIPKDDRIPYNCQKSPMHLSVAVDKFQYRLPYATIFGGIEMFLSTDFKRVNGFPNMFWSWGGEDDNLYQRCTANNLIIHRPSIEIAKYKMLEHASNKNTLKSADNQRISFLTKSIAYIHKDGLNTLQYEILKIEIHDLYTLMKVDLKKGNDKTFFS